MTKTFQILYIEDDADAAAWVELKLQTLSVPVEIKRIEKQDELLSSLQSQAYDLFLLDYMLPDMDGYTALQLIQQQSDAPVIMLSGVLDEEAIVECLRRGAYDFITKQKISRLIPVVERILTDAAKLLETKEQLLSEEKFQRLLFETSPVGLALCHMDGSLVDVNPAYAKILGFSVDETLKLSYWDITPKSYEQQEHAQLKQLESVGSYGPYEKHYIHRDGHLVPVRLRGQIIDRNGEKYIWSSVEDITEAFTAQQELKAYQSNLEEMVAQRTQTVQEQARIIDDLGGAVIATDMQDIITTWNRGAEQIYGYTAREAIGMNAMKLVPSGHTEQTKKITEKITSQQFYNGEVIHQHKDGHAVYVNLNLTLEKDVGGKPQKILIHASDITKQKFYAIALEEHTERLRTVLDTVVDGIITIDEKGIVESFNNSAEKIFSRSSSEVIGHNIKMLMPEPYAHEHDTYLHNYLAGGTPKILGVGREVTGMRKDGSTFPLDLAVSEMFIQGRRMFTGIVRDITKQKLAERELRQTHIRLTHLLDNMPTVLYSVAIENQVTKVEWISQNILQILGYSIEEASQSDWWISNLHPDDREQALVNHTKLFDTGNLSQEYRFRKKSGDYTWILDLVHLECDPQGSPVRIVGIWNDVTERIRTEQALEQSEERLRRSQAFANIGTWDWNIQNGDLYWSERIAPLFGHEVGALETTYENFMNAVHPDDRELVSSSVTNCVERNAVYDIEHRVVWPDGTLRWLSEKGDVVRDKHGAPLRMLGVVQDITERKLSQEALLQARDEAEKASRAKSEFLSSMSHELRTPLNAILGFSQLLGFDSNITSEQRESLKEIHRAGEHLLALINDLLDLTRIESGRISLSIEDVYLHELLNDCHNLIQPLAAKNHIELQFPNTDSTDVHVMADRIRLKQVLLNLLSNAVKYNRPDGQVRLDLAINENGLVQITVRDTGMGISKENLTKLFQPFNRLGAEGSCIEGTGIGLVIAKQLIELMGGTIQAESVLEQGSQFTIEIPVAVANTTQLLSTIDSQAITEFNTHQDTPHQQTVLYVEDNPANLRLVENLFKRIPNVRLLTAHEAGLGLQLANSQQPDLILMDINLPGMDGYEALKNLLNSPATQSIPVIAISANAMPNDIQRGLQAGFVEYLTKPINIEELLNTLDRTLHSSTHQRIAANKT